MYFSGVNGYQPSTPLVREIPSVFDVGFNSLSVV